MSEHAARSNGSSAYAFGTSGHSRESTMSRSQTSTSCSTFCSPNCGRPRQRRNTGSAGTSNGLTMLAGASQHPTSQAQLDHLGRDMPPMLAERKGDHGDLGVDSVGCLRLREEEDPTGRVSLFEAGERLDGGFLPLGRHPGEVGHDARSQVGPLGLVRRFLAEAAESRGHVFDGDVLARPLLFMCMGHAQCRSHSLPSRCISSSAATGPHVPAA